MDAKKFLKLTNEQISEIVAAFGPHGIVCPVNGTRRWFMLEHGNKNISDGEYLEILNTKYIELMSLFFDHGVSSLLLPVFGPDLMARGPEYMSVALQAFMNIAQDPIYTEFYNQYQIQVNFYGDFRKYFSDPKFEKILQVFDQISDRTKSNSARKLFWGLFAHDPTETIAEFSIQHFKQYGNPPKRETIIKHYYNEDPGSVDMFIGFDKFSVFDMPLVATGDEALYFSVSPTPYLGKVQFRKILFDYIYSRASHEDYGNMSEDDMEAMKKFYDDNLGHTLGVGVQTNGIWYPLPQIDFSAFEANEQ